MKELCNKSFEIYKKSAKSRNLEFTLRIEEFTQLAKSNCYYCDSRPRQYADSVRNGVDRLDSKLGYVNGNVITCCSVCNKMKGTLSHDTFLDKIKKIYEENERYRKLTLEEKCIESIKTGRVGNPRLIHQYVKTNKINMEDIHYDYVKSFYLFDDEVALIKDSLVRSIKYLKIPIYDYKNKINKMSIESLEDFYRDFLINEYLNVRKLVKILGGNYKSIDSNFKPKMVLFEIPKEAYSKIM